MFYVLVEYRLRSPAIGAFAWADEAEQFRRSMPKGGKGWHVMPVEQPGLSVEQLQARLVRSGFYSGSGPFEDESA